MLEAKIAITLTPGLPVASVSSSIDALLGFGSSDFLSGKQMLRDLIHKDDQDIADALFAPDLNLLPGTCNIRIRQANGRIRCIKATHSKTLAPSGELQLELLLQDAKSLLRTLDDAATATLRATMESADDLVFFKDRNHVFTGASQTLVSLCEPAQHWTDLLGQTDYDVFPEAYADHYYRLEKQLFAGLPVAHEIQETLSKDGVRGWIDNRKFPIYNAGGDIIGLYGIARDITESKRTDEKLSASEKQYRNLIANLKVGVVIHAPDTSVVLANPQALRLLGLSLAQMQGRVAMDPEWRFIREDGSHMPLEEYPVSQVVATHQALENLTLGICQADSTHVVWVQVSAYGELNSCQELQQIVVTFVDITQRKQAQDTLAQHKFLLSESQRVGQIGSYVLDIQTGTFTSSTVLDQMFGLEPDAEKTIPSWIALVHPEDRNLLRDYFFHDVLGARQAFNREYRVLRANDGATRWLWGRGELSFDLAGKPTQMIGTIQDITSRKDAESALREKEQYLNAILNAAGDPIFVRDEQSRMILVNDAFCSLFELSRAQVIGKTLAEHVAPEEQAHFLSVDSQVIGDGLERSSEEPLTINGKSTRTILTKKTRYTNDKGAHFLVGLIRDITERKQIEVRQQLAASVFAHAHEGITITDPTGCIMDVNDMFTQITGYSREEVLGKNPRILQSGRQGEAFYAAMWANIKAQGFWRGETWNQRKNGEVYAEMLTISAVHDAQGKPVHYVALFSDITAIKNHQHQLETVANFDGLTSLPNRLLLADRMSRAMAQCQRHGTSMAVVFLDLDDLKLINDNYGHAAGDKVLVTVSEQMKEALRDGDTLARVGGDEFVAILNDLGGPEDSYPVIERLMGLAAKPVMVSVPNGDQISDHALKVSASIGVTFYPQDDVDAEVLLRHADHALYLAKQAGKKRYHLFDAAQDTAIRSQHEGQQKVKAGLGAQEFVLYYQPKLNMRTGKIFGAEALIRWQSPERGLLQPAAFLDMVEGHPISIDMGEWVIDTALAQMSAWHAQGLDLKVSVNIGALQLQQNDFPQRLQAILAAHPDVSPGCLQLEILETSALQDISKVTAVMQACQALGVAFALDDFGTGYSSLTYLKRFPAEVLKIDQSFVRDMTEDPDDLAIVKGVIELASIFRREVIAEGVETKALGKLLLAIGCEQAQGYGIARPMPAQDLLAWVALWAKSATWAA